MLVSSTCYKFMWSVLLEFNSALFPPATPPPPSPSPHPPSYCLPDIPELGGVGLVLNGIQQNSYKYMYLFCVCVTEKSDSKGCGESSMTWSQASWAKIQTETATIFKFHCYFSANWFQSHTAFFPPLSGSGGDNFKHFVWRVCDEF